MSISTPDPAMMDLPPALPSLREALTVAFSKWKTIALAFLLPPVLAVAFAFLLTPYYGASSKVLVKAGREYIPETDSTRAPMVAPASKMEEQINSEIEILTSQNLLLQVLREVGIDKVYPDIVANPPAKVSIEEAAVKAFSDDLQIAPVKLSNVIGVTYLNQDRNVAVESLQRLLALFISRHVQAFSSQRVHLLEEQVKDYEGKIAGLEKARAQFKIENDVFSAPEQRTALVQLREKTLQDLLAAQTQQQELKTQIDFLNSQLTKRPRVSGAGSDEQPSTLYLSTRDRVAQLREQRAKLLESLGPRHPQVVEVEGNLRSAEQSLTKIPKTEPVLKTAVNPVADQIDGQRITAGAALAPLTGRAAALKEQLDDVHSRLQAIERNVIAVDDMDRQIDSLEKDLRILRDSLADAKIKENLDQGQVSNISIIEEPNASERPARPKKILFLAAGLVIGLLAALGAFLAALTLRSTFVAVETVERALGLPVLAAVPATPRLAGPFGPARLPPPGGGRP